MSNSPSEDYEPDDDFECCLCGEYDRAAVQHEMLVVAEPTPALGGGKDVEPGIYVITKAPYFGGALCGPSYLFDDSLERLADLPNGIETNGFPCGHLCGECHPRGW